MPSDSTFLATAEAARLLGIRPNTLTRMYACPPDGGPPPVALTTPGGQRRYDRKALIHWRDNRPPRDYTRDPVTGRLIPRATAAAD